MSGIRPTWVAGAAAGLLALGVVGGIATRSDTSEDAPTTASVATPTTTPREDRPTMDTMPTTPAPDAARGSGLSATLRGSSATPLAPTASPVTPARGDGSTSSDLRAAYTRDLGDLAERSGVAIVPVGGADAVRLGTVTEDVAWSTIKVPVVLAAERESGWPAVQERAHGAITVSDNDDAAALWAGLGGGRTAAAKVEAVLADVGDTTRVNPEVTRAGFSPFGQTRWSTTSQATTMSRLRCRADANHALDLMTRVVPAQRWGLGRVSGAPVKGGWGPLPGGGYLVRQMAVIPTSAGEAGVAVIVRHPGGFESGTKDLDRIARWLDAHGADLPGGRCA